MLKRILVLGTFLFAFFPQIAYADGVNLCPADTNGTGFSALCNFNPTDTLPGIITFILIIAIIIALFYLIWGGIKWITSGGDKGNVEAARGQIIAAIIGLIVAFLAWFIINLVLQAFLGKSADGTIELPTIGGSSGSDPGNGTNKRTGAQCLPTNKPDTCPGNKTVSCVRGHWRCR